MAKCFICDKCNDDYVVEDSVWWEAGLLNVFCCLLCLRERIGRAFRITDFPDIDINRSIYIGYRLLIEKEGTGKTLEATI